jgi:hypothetical protein
MAEKWWGPTGHNDFPQLTIVVSTLAMAALFNPAPRRIQVFMDRRFYWHEYDARKTLDELAARLRDETNLDSLHAELVAIVKETMQSVRVSLLLRPDMASGERQRR